MSLEMRFQGRVVGILVRLESRQQLGSEPLQDRTKGHMQDLPSIELIQEVVQLPVRPTQTDYLASLVGGDLHADPGSVAGVRKISGVLSETTRIGSKSVIGRRPVIVLSSSLRC